MAKKKNRAIFGATRSMLHDQGLPLFLWAEVCNTTLYIQSRGPHKVLGSKNPEVAYSGKKPKVGHFKIFGCLTYSHIPSEKMTNLEPQQRRVSLLGMTRFQKPTAYIFLQENIQL